MQTLPDPHDPGNSAALVAQLNRLRRVLGSWARVWRTLGCTESAVYSVLNNYARPATTKRVLAAFARAVPARGGEA